MIVLCFVPQRVSRRRSKLHQKHKTSAAAPPPQTQAPPSELRAPPHLSRKGQGLQKQAPPPNQTKVRLRRLIDLFSLIVYWIFKLENWMLYFKLKLYLNHVYYTGCSSAESGAEQPETETTEEPDQQGAPETRAAQGKQPPQSNSTKVTRPGLCVILWSLKLLTFLQDEDDRHFEKYHKC